MQSQRRKHLVYSTSVCLNQQKCTKCVGFSNGQGRLGQFFWSKSDSNLLDIKLNFYGKSDYRLFRLSQNQMEEAECSQFMSL